MRQSNRKLIGALIALTACSATMIAVACMVGSASIPLDEVLRAVFDRQEAKAQSVNIVINVRLPRALLAWVVGGALAVCGGCLQSVFKNPMAESHVLGISSGAGLGAAIAIALGATGMAAGLGLVSLTAFAGGVAAALLVYALSRVRGRTSTVGLLLAGVALSAFLSAIISVLMILNRNKMEQVILWTMGSFSAVAGWRQLIWGAPLMLAGSLACLAFARELNMMALGDEQAYHMGVDVARTRRIVLVLTSLATSAAVAVSGIIGFVGLMAPHAVRFLIGADNRRLLPVSFLAGGLFLLLADTLARTIAAPLEIPVGVLTAAAGAPFFLMLLRKKGV